MKKQLFKSGTKGILIGLVVSMIMSLIWAPSYMPLNPHSAIGQWMTSHQVHGSMVLAYCLITWFAIGILFEVASYIFRKAEWSLLRATLTHYALTCLGFIPLATLSGWFPLRLTFYLELVIEFSLIYLLVWVFSYWKMKKDIEQLNKEVEANQDKVNEARGTVQKATDDMQFCWNELKNTAVGTSQDTQQAITNAYEQAKNEVQSKLGIIDSDTSSTFSKFGNIGANAGSDLSSRFSSNISDIPYSAKRAYQSIVDQVEAGEIGEETGSQLMQALADTIDSKSWLIQNALSNSFASKFSGEVFDNNGNISESAFHIAIQPKPRAYAVGGFPEDGLFFANHNELVGKFSNGKTAVANNEQITDGIKQAVIEGMSEVFANANIGQQNGNIVVQIDGQEVFRTTQRYANHYTAMTGQPAFNI